MISLLRGAICSLVIVATGAQAEELRLVEQEVKAGLIYNFLKYTTWPAPQDEAASVCVYLRDPFGGGLSRMAGRTVNQRTIAVRIAATPADARACSLLFVGAEQAQAWPALKGALAGRPTMTVSDATGFSSRGGMIEFTRMGDHIGMAINRGAIADAGLKVQDRLLRLAGATNSDASAP
jgi:hypothetical protein